MKRTWSAKRLGIPAPLGGLLFSPDGGTLYVVGSAEESDSAVYAVPVKRDSINNEVVKLGPKSAVTKFFDGDASTVGLTAGLEYGPADTLFFSYWDANYLGQRPGAGSGAETLFFLEPLGVPESVAGITFSPHIVDPATGFGRPAASPRAGRGGVAPG